MLNLFPINIPSMRDAQRIIEGMQKTKISFYLTGSHLFGNTDRFSDLDFFAEDSTATRDLLVDLGFKLESTSYNSTDPMVTEVWAYPGPARFMTVTPLIHVQLVPNLDEKLAVQEALYVYKRESPTKVDWQMGFNFINTFRGILSRRS